MAEQLNSREESLRALPLQYALALRLRDARIASEVICEYVNVAPAALISLYRTAEMQLLAAQGKLVIH
jgi:hypothetical protein